MKKLLLAVAMITLAAGGAFALDMAAGGGAYFTSDFGGGFKGFSPGGSGSLKMPYYGGGGFVFFDAAYLEISTGFFYGAGKMKLTGKDDEDYSVMGLDAGFMGKFPFVLHEKFSVFPLLGVSYRAMLSVKQGGEKSDYPEDFNAFWFKAGAGFDISFTGNVFLRTTAAYGIRLENQAEKDTVSFYNGDALAHNSTAVFSSLLGHGVEVKVGVGYRF